MDKRIIVTGATSFLGQYIVRELIQRGNKVFAVIRPSSPKIALYKGNENITIVSSDLSKIMDQRKKIDSADAFIHLGWDGVGAEGRNNLNIQLNNVQMTEECFRFASALGCKRFLFSGSQAEYGPQAQMITEETVCKPVLNYGRGKLMVLEKCSGLAEQLNMIYYHTRIFSVYGIGDHPWALVPNCIKTLCSDRQMKLSTCSQSWNFLHASVAAKVLVDLLNSNVPSGIYNIAGHDTRCLKDFIKDIYSACKSGSLSFGTHQSQEPIVSLIPCIAKLESAIGEVQDVPFSEEIDRMVNAYKSTGNL